jgi:hypothetical protein
MFTNQIIAAAAIGLAAVGCSASQQAAPPSTATLTKSVTATVTPTPPPMSVQLRTWDSGIESHFQQLADAGASMAAAAKHQNIVGIGASCQQLHDAAANMQQHMPSPDPELTHELQAAISDYDAGTHFCMAGTKSYDMEELNQMITFLTSANDHMDTAVTVLHRDMGSTGGITTAPTTKVG